MKQKKINLALVGSANVGKSVIFNYLTGLHQHIGNWAGKTIEKAEGTLHYKGYTIDVLDLPGICSLSTYSLEELITREHIVSVKPDFIINVINAANLETNLILTLQLLELEKPMVLALNMVDLLKKRGIKIDLEKLETILEIPVVPVAAIYGKGITAVLDRGISLAYQKTRLNTLKYGKEVEERIEQLHQMLQNVESVYPERFIAIKLLEKDEEIGALLKITHPEILEKAKSLRLELEKIHGHSSAIIIADERCLLASRIARKIMTITKPQKISAGEILDNLTGHKILGYPIMIVVLGLTFFIIFKGGAYVSSLLDQLLTTLQINFYNTFGNALLSSLILSSISSFFALLSLALPFILPFYFILFILEGLGYLARVAYLMDNLMHKLGIHGKACIPLILGFGCNVPACLSCRIMETQRERFITGLLTVFVPCSAVAVVVAGLVGKFLGIYWVLGIYFFVFLIIFVIGKIASIITPGEPTELIMEMPSYKLPNIKTIALYTWFKLKEFVYVAGPIVIISGIVIEGASAAKLLSPISDFLSPITSKWLGLPSATGILLFFGILRKELILVLLASVLGTTNFALVLTPAQIFILALVSMLYIPCVATIAAIYKEFGWKKALLITLLKIALAIIVGGLVLRLLNFTNLLSFDKI
jgi:ferrous iron transport protein B